MKLGRGFGKPLLLVAGILGLIASGVAFVIASSRSAVEREAHNREVAAEMQKHQEEKQDFDAVVIISRQLALLQAKLDKKADAIQQDQHTTLGELKATDTVPCVGRYGSFHPGTPLYIRAFGMHTMHGIDITITGHLDQVIARSTVPILSPNPLGIPISVNRPLPEFLSIRMATQNGEWIETIADPPDRKNIHRNVTLEKDFGVSISPTEAKLMKSCLAYVQ